ncbi:hypothetical protein AYI69_g7204 [Smittium culicis]|uniref:CCHC-type domain-containing protein n=1 Tax=Smittium culicis TaxID=133412 RepID=A0A1R1XTL3_9FUNG|nr:hypothetical protein AYI69_g7204 [Smittium culicis]
MSAKVLKPKIFFGKEGEDSSRWMKRYECFRKACKWSDSEATDYLDLFLEGRSLNWYKGFTINNKEWEIVKAKFLEVFTDKDEETTSWNEMIKFDCNGKDSIEISGLLTHLFAKAKIVSENEKLKYLMKSLDPSKRRKILESNADTFENALEILAREEKYSKLIGEESNDETKTKKIIKEMEVMDSLVKRVDSLSLNLLNREREMEKLIRDPTEKQSYRSYANYKCYNCNQYGHRIDQCRYPKITEDSPNIIDRKVHSAEKVVKEINCMELEPVDLELFSAEKRHNSEENSSKSKRTRVVDEILDKDVGKFSKNHHIIQSRSPATIKLSADVTPYSIGKNLANSKVDLSYSQLLQVSPSIRSELINLCKKQETKELGNVEFDESMNTNCRGLVKIFNDRYWAILDTGVACSVISTAFMEEIGLEVDEKSDQVVITADGTKHSTLGSVTGLPIKVANYSFPCKALVLELAKPLLILGTDWFSKYNAVIDIKSKEIILEKPEVDVVMRLYINKPNHKIRDEYELFGIGIEQTTVKDDKESTIINLKDALNGYENIFASNLSELTQTDVVEHAIDTGDSKPVRQYPSHDIDERLRDKQNQG